MELVWKDLAKVHAPCRPAKRSEHAEQLRKGPVREHIAFKFVPGTSKRQRNGNGAYRSAVAHPELNGLRPVFSVRPTRHGASPLPAPEANDEDARSVLSSSKSQGLRDDEASHGSQSHDDTRGSGHDGSPQTHEPGGDDDTSGLHVQVDAAAGTFEYRPWLGCTDEATAVSEWYYISPCMRPPDDDDEAAPVEHGIELEVNMPPIYEVTNAQEPSDRSTGCDFLLDVGVRYQTLTEKYDQVLRMYDQEFCVIPLSGDCPSNPFRVDLRAIRHYDFLLHAVMAVSTQHLAKKNDCAVLLAEMHQHWSTALHLFSQSLNKPEVVPLLDTLLVLVSLETTQSASAMWAVHLNGAYQLLQQYGSLEKCRYNPRMRAQLAMLLWWDVTIALVARKEPRFPVAYLDSFLKDDKNDGWTFFDLNGCPLELLLSMSRLAKLACIHEQTLQMEWTIFDRSSVDMVLTEVKDFTNDAEVGFEDLNNLEEEANVRRNRYHCVEAWRHAIMLYVCRVFTREQDPYQLRQIDHLARVILDSVRCIPETDILQKQLLLPVFLAACESCSETDRVFIRQYCKHWSKVSRFYHFESAAAVLEDIWKDWSLSTRSVYWWGVKVGNGGLMGSGVEAQGTLAMELLLG